jgi:outer membrane murein-binding lipoprotein Lpp
LRVAQRATTRHSRTIARFRRAKENNMGKDVEQARAKQAHLAKVVEQARANAEIAKAVAEQARNSTPRW